jgi:hypothetical protein
VLFLQVCAPVLPIAMTLMPRTLALYFFSLQHSLADWQNIAVFEGALNGAASTWAGSGAASFYLRLPLSFARLGLGTGLLPP